jgi:hypothetical protein
MTRKLPIILALLLALLPFASAPSLGAPREARGFASPQAAADALVGALRAGDIRAADDILGGGSARLLDSGDRVADAAARGRFIAAYDAHHALVAKDDTHSVLVVGENDWPLPLPIVAAGGSWRFDTAAGGQEIIDRRIGGNEIAAIRTLLAFVDAQKLYFEMAKEAFGTGYYARHMVSSPGEYDGLYWPAEPGETPSPLAPLVAEALDDGYPGALERGRQLPYHGYYFRILDAQGKHALGGPHTYVENGRMTGGFALLAWPASHGASGIMSFEIDQDGVVFQKDLGADTARLAPHITRYDPDVSWARVDLTAN